MSGPKDALEQMGLLRDRLSLPEYSRYMQPFMEDVARKRMSAVTADPDGNPSGWQFCQREIARLKMAEAYYVSAEMMPLTRWAAAGLESTDRFEREVWPTDYGFLLFEEPMVGIEMWGRTVTTKAITWGRAVGTTSARRPGEISGTLVNFYTDMNDPNDEVNVEIREKAIAAKDWDKYLRMGPLHVHHVMFIPDDERVGPPEIVPPEDYARFAVGTTNVLAKSTTNDSRFLLALLMLLNQTVTSVAEHQMDKQTAKRFGRMKIPSKITVIQLRRHEGSRQHGESLVEWAHRWVVRGYWRNQPYKVDGKTVYRRIWIAPHIKGPEGLPLKQSEKVYAFVR